MNRSVFRHRAGGLILATVLVLVLTQACSRKCDCPGETAIVPVTDTIHGVEIVDHYRWLENGDDTAVIAWENRQDRCVRQYLTAYPDRAALEQRIIELMRIGTMHSPAICGGQYFYMKRAGDEDHAILYRKRRPDAPAEVVLDPNSFSSDATVALDWWFPSPDGRYLAFGKSAGGTENSTLFILDIDRQTMLADTIPQARAASIAWEPESGGFYYTRYPLPGELHADDDEYYRWVYYHRLGGDYRQDPLVFGRGRDKTDWPNVQLSPDGRYLMVVAYQGWTRSEMYLKDLQDNGDFVLINPGVAGLFSIQLLDDDFYVMTNHEAPRYRILRGSYPKPRLENWREIIPESEATLENFGVVGDKIVLLRLADASSRLVITDLDGGRPEVVTLPAIGSIMSGNDHVLGGEHDGHEILFGYNSFSVSPRIYHYDLKSDSLRILDAIETDLDLDNFEINYIRYASTGGDSASMFLTHRRDLVLDGNNPTLVYGYGGFNVNQTPYFSRTMTHFLDKGGVYAYTQIRGGGEYGEDWHRDGMLERKQNSFDDFIAAVEWLIENRYTNPEKVVIEGGSNGGLLVGAVLVQRPDLMKAVVCSRPLLDMVRYHKFLIGELWIPELGSPDQPEQFEYLYEYSPYHRVRPGVAYPAVLFESADHDTRVGPMHARKMTAALQAATTSDNPILLRVQRQTGHGQGAPRRIVLEELIDSWCFIFGQLGL